MTLINLPAQVDLRLDKIITSFDKTLSVDNIVLTVRCTPQIFFRFDVCLIIQIRLQIEQTYFSSRRLMQDTQLFTLKYRVHLNHVYLFVF